ncbi:hypothetical protein CQP30_13345 [Yersinia pestis]|nr:hypothetical protein EGX42_02830 [Yersinia pestis]EDR66065.1 conserved hypothetical protein [Yersinia pestis biovar Mediaevalis str. K1973002]OSZ87975.1 hypothetical protein A7725_12525 [Yersinia pestis subsp. microtus bv. Caucasica]OUY13777.1 hypothetical protein BFI40_14140 [Yersinia pestis subsp. microtus bv. Altaica]OVY75540.1 hypothetical protein BFI50_13175 [Yersinia pestis subsp. microtus bv. Xilingolensis]OVY84612.1 hypothetical protein BFI52_12415 [Yersinia pestis subsp. microtus]
MTYCQQCPESPMAEQDKGGSRRAPLFIYSVSFLSTLFHFYLLGSVSIYCASFSSAAFHTFYHSFIVFYTRRPPSSRWH